MPDSETINAFNQTIVDEFRTNGGKVTGQFANSNLLLLTTTGAKSGQPRVNPLAHFRIDGKLIIIGSFAGAPVSPACTICAPTRRRTWRSAWSRG